MRQHKKLCMADGLQVDRWLQSSRLRGCIEATSDVDAYAHGLGCLLGLSLSYLMAGQDMSNTITSFKNLKRQQGALWPGVYSMADGMWGLKTFL